MRRGALLPVALAALLVAAPAPARSTIYSYTDEAGVVHYTNVPNDPRFRKVAGSEPPPPPRAATAVDGKFSDHIARAADDHGVDPALVKAVIKAESNFDPQAVSRAGAQGLMQLMPETARLCNVANSFNPADNITGGENAVRRYNGVPPYPETRNYVTQVLANYGQYTVAPPAKEGAAPAPAAPIQTFTNAEGTVVFTNTPWRYLESSSWRRGRAE